MERYLTGTAYIIYGDKPESITDKPHEHSTSNANCHNHSEKEKQPCHFWAVFLPDCEEILGSDPPNQQSNNSSKMENQDLQAFVLKGTPYPWGTYPPDMPPPHGCIPPRLYYHLTIIECNNSLSKVSLDHQTKFKINGSGSNHNEWTIPYVHRLGDGNDDAGGLTSGYFLLQTLEDADDNGEFLEQKLQHFKTGDPSNLYGSTQVLFSEHRTFQILDQYVFPHLRGNCSDHDNENCISGTPPLCELQSIVTHYLDKIKAQKLDQLPFSVLKSDMKLLLAK